jgi:iron complex outermembrane receptor protein
MSSIRVNRRLYLAISVVLAAAATPTAHAAETRATPNVLEEVVVTATKREERLQDVPTAITALSAETLARAGIQDFRDYATLVPGLSQRDLGIPGVGTVILRGMNTSAQQLTNTTGYYLDESPFTASGFLSVNGLLTPSPDLGDVERIEVLKGPQGTLFGANSIGGLIRVISKSPDATKFSGSARAEISSVSHGDIGWSGRGSVNVPLVENKVALRMSGGYRQIGGFIDNAQAGTRDVNQSEVYGGRVALRAMPSDQLTLDAFAFIQTIESNASSTQALVPRTLTRSTPKYSFRAFADLPTKIDYSLYSASVDYDFGAASWITTVSYAKLESRIQLDSTRTYVPPFAALVPVGTVAAQDYGPNNRKRSVESRLTSKRLGRFEFIAGVFYTDEDSLYPITIKFLNPTTLAPLPTLGTPVVTGTLSKYTEKSAFGNVTYYLTDQLDVTLGLRTSKNDDVSTTGAPVNGVPATIFFVPRAPIEYRSSDSPQSYLATLRWRPSETVSTYLRAASGYRPGGPQTNPAPPPGAQTQIQPDDVWSYEGGVKGSFAEGRVALDASVYRINWKDMQLSTTFGQIVLQGNAGRGRIDGAEFTATVRPTSSLTVTAAAGYTDAKIKEITAGASASLGARPGDSLPMTPKWTASLMADQNFAVSGAATASIGATLRSQAEVRTSYPTSVAEPMLVLPGFTTLDLRAGLNWGSYQVQLRVENVFDKFAFTYGSANAGTGIVIRPMTVTLGLTAGF